MKKIFISNRSEVARRIQSTCRSLDIETVAVFEDKDSFSSYVSSANQAYQLSGVGFQAYQAQDELVSIAVKSGADAVHPGYGFLAENSLFAQKVIDAGLTWIGPSPSIIACMGNKCEATKIAAQAGIPVIPSVSIDVIGIDSFEHALSEAKKIGFPVLLKDPLGGGGKGMRFVGNEYDFALAWASVCSESQRLTGSQKIIVEKFFCNVRHIEVQVAGDGNSFIHLYERECSIQRRHQKIIEESPSSFVSQFTLEKMYEASIRLASCVGYSSLGTIEFIVTEDERFYFLEMNTRLQVEHSITELTTGIDLVELQIIIAQTGILPINQQSIIRQGHAVECRIYAENTHKNFMPMTGIITRLQIPSIPFGRVDHDLYDGFEVSSFFDPMIAKISTYAPDRKNCLRRMISALDDFIIDGVQTNNNFLKSLLRNNCFVSGNFSTQLLGDKNFINELNNIDNLNCKDYKDIALIAAAIKDFIFEESEINQSNDQNCFDNWKEQLWE